MKKITFTLSLLLFSILTFAQQGNVGHLTIFSESGDKFYLILNGEQQNDIAQTNLRIEDLNQPYYEAKIIFESKSLTEISKSYLPITDGDGVYSDVTYKIKKDKNNQSKMKMSFFSQIPVQQHYIAPKNVYVMHYGQPMVTQTTTTTTTSGGGVGVGMNVGGINMNVNVNDPYGNTVTQTTTTQTSDTQYNDNGPRGHHNGNHGCHNKYAMSPGDFNSAMASVKKQSFEDVKLKTAKQIVSANCMSVNQIVAIAKTFSFEDNKLDFAKYAYDFCIEPENYFKLNDIFSFSSNADELSEYIQSRQ